MNIDVPSFWQMDSASEIVVQQNPLTSKGRLWLHMEMQNEWRATGSLTLNIRRSISLSHHINEPDYVIYQDVMKT